MPRAASSASRAGWTNRLGARGRRRPPRDRLLVSEPGRVGDRRGEVLVLLAIGAADPLDRLQLRLGAAHVALEDKGLAEILADQRVGRIERHRSPVIIDPLIEPAELARGIAAI